MGRAAEELREVMGALVVRYAPAAQAHRGASRQAVEMLREQTKARRCATGFRL
ncbi:hypothetical protein RSWS8N_12575 [Cereibacter sphaeroides WS8N]|nr:hypothetical protein RSWS8N_12575 [Cereibacter sphaeroides WS8N]